MVFLALSWISPAGGLHSAALAGAKQVFADVGPFVSQESPWAMLEAPALNHRSDDACLEMSPVFQCHMLYSLISAYSRPSNATMCRVKRFAQTRALVAGTTTLTEKNVLFQRHINESMCIGSPYRTSQWAREALPFSCRDSSGVVCVCLFLADLAVAGVHLKDGPHTYATHCGWHQSTVIGLMALGATRVPLGQGRVSVGTAAKVDHVFYRNLQTACTCRKTAKSCFSMFQPFQLQVSYPWHSLVLWPRPPRSCHGDYSTGRRWDGG